MAHTREIIRGGEKKKKKATGKEKDKRSRQGQFIAGVSGVRK